MSVIGRPRSLSRKENTSIAAGVKYTLHSDAGVRLTPIGQFALALRAAVVLDGARAVSPRAGPGGIAAGAGAFARNHARADGADGLEDAASRLAGQQGLVFLVSDFHWPLERLSVVLDLLAHASVVPVVVWDPAETEPPVSNALASLRDAAGFR